MHGAFASFSISTKLTAMLVSFIQLLISFCFLISKVLVPRPGIITLIGMHTAKISKEILRTEEIFKIQIYSDRNYDESICNSKQRIRNLLLFFDIERVLCGFVDISERQSSVK